MAEIIWHPVEDYPSSRLSTCHSIQTTIPKEIPPFLYCNLLTLAYCKSCSHGKPQGPEHRGKDDHLWTRSQPFHHPDLLVACCSGEEFWGWRLPGLFGHCKLCNWTWQCDGNTWYPCWKIDGNAPVVDPLVWGTILVPVCHLATACLTLLAGCLWFEAIYDPLTLEWNSTEQIVVSCWADCRMRYNQYLHCWIPRILV